MLLLDRDGPNAQQQFIGSILTGDITFIDLIVADWTRVHELFHLPATSQGSGDEAACGLCLGYDKQWAKTYPEFNLYTTDGNVPTVWEPVDADF